MKIWIYNNGQQQGPYTYDQFAALGVDGSTPVWYDGLPQWTRADLAPLTAPLYGAAVGGPAQFAARQTYVADPNVVVVNNVVSQPPCPPTYLFWSIFITCCCCQPGGIAGIIMAIVARSRYNNGDYRGARRMSEYIQWVLIISIVLGLMTMPFAFLF